MITKKNRARKLSENTPSIDRNLLRNRNCLFSYLGTNIQKCKYKI
jgi:hypothetical protein